MHILVQPYGARHSLMHPGPLLTGRIHVLSKEITLGTDFNSLSNAQASRICLDDQGILLRREWFPFECRA